MCMRIRVTDPYEGAQVPDPDSAHEKTGSYLFKEFWMWVTSSYNKLSRSFQKILPIIL